MNNRGLFIGLTTIDIQFFTSNFPTPNQKIKTEMPFITAGGPAANAAITYTTLGGNADFITCIGNHQFTDTIKKDLNNYSLRVIDVVHDLVADPIVSAIITTTNNSERTIFTHHPNKLTNLKDVPELNLDSYDFVFTDGFYPELAVDICIKAKGKGIPVIFDGGSWKEHLHELLFNIDIAICSKDFIPPGCSSMADVFHFLSQYNICEMAISRGGESIVTPIGDIDIEKVNAIDSLGSGDILHGAFCYFWNENKQLIPSLKQASKIATCSTQFKGTRNWIKYIKMASL